MQENKTILATFLQILIADFHINPNAHAVCWSISGSTSCSKNESTSNSSSGRSATAETVISKFLKDPDSAKFEVSGMTDEYLCARVNAKNSFGGYSGSKKVLVMNYQTSPIVLTESNTGYIADNNMPVPQDVAQAADVIWRSICGA